MKYFVEEITILKDGATPTAVTPKNDYAEALSAYHQCLASAIISESVASIHCEVKDEKGVIYEASTYEA